MSRAELYAAAFEEHAAMKSEIEDLKAEVIMLKKHWSAIEVFISDGSTDLSEFASQFPRTWNALKTDDYMNFKLPASDNKLTPGTRCKCGLELNGDGQCVVCDF